MEDHWASVQCQCGVRLAADCPGAWEKGCDLGANEAMRLVPTGVEAEVCADITRRQALGVIKYGQTVAENPLTHEQWLQHGYEEALGLAVYLKRAMRPAVKHLECPTCSGSGRVLDGKALIAGGALSGWLFTIEGDTVRVASPIDGPGVFVAHESSGSHASRMLYALAKALS